MIPDPLHSDTNNTSHLPPHLFDQESSTSYPSSYELKIKDVDYVKTCSEKVQQEQID